MSIFAQFFAQLFKKIAIYKKNPHNLRGYWTKLHLIFTCYSNITTAVTVDNSDIAICCAMPEQRVNMVNLDICKWLLQLTSYHSNIPVAIMK